MKVENIGIEKIVPYENNPRLNSNSVDKVVKSIEEFGWQQPIVVDKDMTIIVGHTRYEAAKKIGLEEVPVVVASTLTEKQSKAYRLADNKVADYSVWDNKKLLEELDELDDIFTGFDESEIFRDVLDEQDNSVIEENEKGVYYTGKFQVNDLDKFERIKAFIDDTLNE